MPPETHNENQPEAPKNRGKEPIKLSPEQYDARMEKLTANFMEKETKLAQLDAGLSFFGLDRDSKGEKYPKMAQVMKRIDNFLKDPTAKLPSRDDILIAYKEQASIFRDKQLAAEKARDDENHSCGANEEPKELKGLSNTYDTYEARLKIMLKIQDYTNKTGLN